MAVQMAERMAEQMAAGIHDNTKVSAPQPHASMRLAAFVLLCVRAVVFALRLIIWLET